MSSLLSGETSTDLIRTFLATLSESNPGVEAAVILVGSVARSAATAQSDLDLLVISEQGISVRRSINRLHVQAMSEAEFLDRLKSGDDFAAWCVRFGIPIRSAATWYRIVEGQDADKWPDWRPKIEHAARRLLLANDLVKLRDEAAAAEELLYAISHVARAILLKKNVFPLSRPEMISQLNETEDPNLGALLEDFSFQRRDEATIRRTILYLKKLLVHLERPRFEAYVRKRKDAQKRKTERRPASSATP